MSHSTEPLIACNICAGTAFQPGPLKRLSNTGRLPCCVACGSLERHRIARRVFDLLPDALVANRKVLQFSRDDSIDPSRVAQLRVSEYGSSDSLDIQAIAAGDGSYDWVVSHHVVNFVPDDAKALSEMLRVAGPNGAVLLTVGGTTDSFDTRVFDEPTGPHAAYKIYGSDFVERIWKYAPKASVLEIVATDPCTATLDVIYVYSERTQLLAEIGRAMAPHNLYARLNQPGNRPDSANGGATNGTTTQPAQPAPTTTRMAAKSTAGHQLDSEAWRPLISELGEWRKLGHRPRFWLRDDDATRAHERLQALWQVCDDNQVTLACAAIPDTSLESLAHWAAGRRSLVMLQHGFNHVNRAKNADSSEFPDSRELEDAMRDVQRGQDRMRSLFKAQQLPVFVPPWGRISAKVTAELGSLGFIGVSGTLLRQAPRENGIAVVNTHVLIPRKTEDGWAFDAETAVSRLVTVLLAIRARGESDLREPIGINTHHATVGTPELEALVSLIRLTRDAGADWPHPADIFEGA